tara:strand:- start:479 stop:733 length:255 start_codon:yes stop_codon:yes gene_type:complete
MPMSDHQDSENFSYSRSWEDIENMLAEAERKQNQHLMAINRKGADKKERMYHMRKFKGLEGVIRGLRWTLGDLKMTRKRVLGDE